MFGFRKWRAQTLSAAALLPLLVACETTKDPNIGEAVKVDVPEVQTQALEPVPMRSAFLDKSQSVSRIAIGSCLKQAKDQSIWDTIGATNPDLFLFTGDNVYGDNVSGNPAVPELREAYGVLAQSQPFAKFREATPLLVTWDDHDYGLNDAGGSFRNKQAAEDLFDYVWAVPEDSVTRRRGGVYDSHMIGTEPGKMVQVILLDTRYFRSELTKTDVPGAPGKERYLPDADKNKTMLGEEQWWWLKQELEKPADLRILVSSMQVVADGHGWEAWRNLPSERRRLYDLISSTGAENTIIVSGDRHAAAIYKRDLVAAYPIYEMTASSLNDPGSQWRTPQSGTEPGPFRITDMYYEENFGLVDIDWEAEEISLKIVSRNSETVLQKDIPLSDLRPVY